MFHPRSPILLLWGAGVIAVLAQDAVAWPRLRRHCGDYRQEKPSEKYPEAVARIMKVLPQIPADASPDKIIAMLGLPKHDEELEEVVDSHHCWMMWTVAPGYRFSMSFDWVLIQGDFKLVFSGASVSAQQKPGSPSEEYQTVYPRRARNGMVYE